MPGVVFQSGPRAVARDSNRMDIAAFFGFLPLRPDPLPRARRDEIARSGWAARLADEGELRDIPIRIDSLAEFEALFLADGRPDRAARVRGEALPESQEVGEETRLVVVEVDGVVSELELPLGPTSRAELLDALAAAFADHLEFTLEQSPSSATVFLTVTRSHTGQAGSLTVFANPAIGFAVAARDETRLVGCPMAAAVRAFFGSGGRSCYVVRMGDPLPLISIEADRVRQLGLLLTGGDSFAAQATSLTQIAGSVFPPIVSAAAPQDDWHGFAHLHALEDATYVLAPDLTELLSERAPVEVEPEDAERPPALFEICAEESPARLDGAVSLMEPPRCGEAGLMVWIKAVRWFGEMLRGVSEELLGAIAAPLPTADLRGGYVARLAELLGTNVERSDPPFHRIQVAYPWLRTRFADQLPGGVMAADGHLAGIIAATTLAQGAFRTASGSPLADVIEPFPADADGFTPDVEPGRSISLIGRQARGIELLSDVTISGEPGFRPASVRRLVALVLRAARYRGEAAVFEASGEALWGDVAYSLRTILRNIYTGGGLRGETESQAFAIACDRSTMSQADIDAGRVIAEIGINPAQSVETILVALTSESGGALRPAGGAP